MVELGWFRNWQAAADAGRGYGRASMTDCIWHISRLTWVGKNQLCVYRRYLNLFSFRLQGQVNSVWAYRHRFDLHQKLTSSNTMSNVVTMSSLARHPPIILYHYPYSPYARRIVWYLRLRGISYSECVSRIPPISHAQPLHLFPSFMSPAPLLLNSRAFT
jgi:hypothetical protein